MPSTLDVGENSTATASPATAAEGEEGLKHTNEGASSTRSGKKFVLVSHNGQQSLVPAETAHEAIQTQHVDTDESGATTPVNEVRKTLIKVKRGRGRPPKRGRGRPPKNAVFEYEYDEDAAEDDGMDEDYTQEAETPAEDGEDGDMTLTSDFGLASRDYTMKGDELELDDDEQGDTKIDAMGNLLGGRQFGFRTFKSPYRPDREVQYALSIDAARVAGYRDSFYFYRKNPLLIKLNCTDEEKDMLIEEGRLSGHLRSRIVTMVAVRNVYKLHGARIIKGGRAVIDDYYEKLARESGRTPGELVEVVQETVPVAPRVSERRREAREVERERERTRKRPDAFTYATTDLQGNPAFTTFGDSGESPFERAKAWTTRRANLQRAELNDENWMMEMARSVRGMNRELLAGRVERLKAFNRPYEAIEGPFSDDEEQFEDAKEGSIQLIADGEGEEKKVSNDVDPSKKRKTKHDVQLPIGLYEPLSNMPHYPHALQSQWAYIERTSERPLLDNEPKDKKQTNLAALGGAKVGGHAWGVASIEQNVQLPQMPLRRDVRLPAKASYQDS